MTRFSEDRAADALAALGNRTRLQVFRLLIKAGPEGLNAGELQKHLSVPASTLAHHLTTLARAGLVRQEKHGREVITSADSATVKRLSDFILEECCHGVDDTSVDDVA